MVFKIQFREMTPEEVERAEYDDAISIVMGRYHPHHPSPGADQRRVLADLYFYARATPSKATFIGKRLRTAKLRNAALKLERRGMVSKHVPEHEPLQNALWELTKFGTLIARALDEGWGSTPR